MSILNSMPTGYISPQKASHESVMSGPGATFTGASFDISSTKFRLLSCPFSLPKMNTDAMDEHTAESLQTSTTSTQLNCGEDSFYIAKIPSSKYCTSVGIADGVSGWNTIGINSSEMSRSLMNHAMAICLTKPEIDARSLLRDAYEHVVNEQKIVGGSCTACILCLSPHLSSLTTGAGATSGSSSYEHHISYDPQSKSTINHTFNTSSQEKAKLCAANLGDSGFIILRRDPLTKVLKKVYKSNPQRHAHSCPFQLSIIPSFVENAKQYISDKPSDAEYMEVAVQVDDIIILATDGLFDNLFDEQIVEIVDKNLPPSESTSSSSNAKNSYNSYSFFSKATTPSSHNDYFSNKFSILYNCSKELCLNARTKALGNEETPFSKENKLKGGKEDDVTVIVSLVLSLHDPHQQTITANLPHSDTDRNDVSMRNQYFRHHSFLSGNMWH